MQQRRSQVAIFHWHTDFSTRSRLSVQVQSISNQALRISVNGDSTNNCTHAQICTGYAQLQCHLVVLFEGSDHGIDREILVLLHVSKSEGAIGRLATAFNAEEPARIFFRLQREEAMVSLPKAATSTP